MRYKKAWLVSLAMLTQLTFGSPAHAMPVDMDYGSWHGSLNGQMQNSVNGSGTSISLKDDLGFSDRSIHSGRISLGEPKSYQLTRLEFARMNYAGDTIVSRDIQYNGQTYTANSRVISSLQADYGRVGIVRPIDLASSLQVYSVFDVRFLRFDSNLQADGGPKSADTVTAVFPTAGIGASMNISSNCRVFAEFSGMTLGKYGRVVDAEAGLKFQIPRSGLEFAGGYRVLSIHADADDDYVNFKVKGPYASATLKF